MTQIRPFLMFQGAVAAQAIDLYLSAFPSASVISSQPHPEASQGIMLAELDLAGQRVLVSDSAIDHAFDFTPSSSLFVDADDRAQLERLVEILGEGGGTLMPLDDYGFSQAFAWVNDRFGVSWQLNLP
ncbi:VOC family protein [Gordonia sp. (in: high G+C Gram-positive bacteria)]|uniref:VOC family protein n=1 Tax=Gordonia sp. (in: high G+C Gram-positive bacteria) TaxID=84139 RepID=UPI00169013AE|nr:VOC family protein [Gordonia sp. (in: high G+C Gram-positive bacteria)]NLG45571.1 VOC family protein [Gordonia sp. (in: high G+C Gram-positive bacteria)]